MSWRAIVLAAGQGTRMNSDLAKVMHPLRGETLLAHVLRTASRLPIEKTAVVVGHQHERVRGAHAAWDVVWVLQEPQRGTGHAVQQAEDFLRRHDGSTLVLYGDVPLLRRHTLFELMEEHLHEGNAVTVPTARVSDPAGYGRIIRDAGGAFEAITEDGDLLPDQRGIDEINSGIYAFRTADLLEVLGHLRDDNRQGELYLTDTVFHLRHRGRPVGTYTVADPREISGVNTPTQLAAAEAVLERRRRTGTEDCPICDLADRGDGYPVLSRSVRAILIVTPRPYNSGQIAAHPLRHALRHSDLDADERRELWALGEIAASAVETIYHPQGMNIGYNSGVPGEHIGLQIIPRWIGDANFLPLLADVTLLPESLEMTYHRVREALGARGTVR